MKAWLRRTAAVWVLVATAAPSFGEEPPAFDDPRQLPSLEIVWRQGSRPIAALAVEGGVVYAAGYSTLAAHDAATGERLWGRSFSQTLQSLEGGPLLLDDLVAAVFGREVHLLDRASGATAGTYRAPAESRHRVEIAGSPLTAKFSVRGEEQGSRIRQSHHLVRLDAANAVAVAERTFADADLFAWRILDGHPVARTTLIDGNQSRSTLVGLDPDNLDVRWQLPVEYSDFREVDGELYLEVPDGETARLYAFDPGAGTLAREPIVVPVQVDFCRFADELVESGHDKPPHLLRRVDRRTGEALWTQELPAPAGPHVRLGDRLFVQCRPLAGGRGLLAEIGWDDGELRRVAYSLKGVGSLAAAGDLLIAATDEGLVAFAHDRFGPPEAATRSVGEEVRRILAGLERRRFPDRHAEGELRALGPEALPILAELAGGLGPVGLQAAARILGDAAYRPAGEVLARRLAAELERTEPREPWQSPKGALLHALATTGTSREAGIVGQLLLDPREADDPTARSIRRQAYFTLASIGTPEALAWIDRARTPQEKGSWWTPPDPGPFLELLGREIGAAEMAGVDDVETHERLYRHRLIRTAEGGGRRLLVFPFRFFGSTDLWAAEISAEGRPGEPFFLGVSHVGLAGFGFQAGLEADLEGGRLILRATVGAGRATEVDLDRARSDRDGDGLPDLVEGRLGTDPESADTDGDGVRDAEDLAPDARESPPGSEEEEILAAVFETYFRLWEANRQGGLAVVTGAPALEWQGRTGPTLTVDESEYERLRAAADFSEILKITIRPDEDNPDLADRRARLRPGELLYVVNTMAGNLGGRADIVVVRKIGDRWVVRWIKPWTIS